MIQAIKSVVKSVVNPAPAKGQKLAVGDIVDGREVKFVRDFKHPDDKHLQLVLCQYEGEYVVWVYNNTTCGFNYGHYHTTFKTAFDKFIDRMIYWGI